MAVAFERMKKFQLTDVSSLQAFKCLLKCGSWIFTLDIKYSGDLNNKLVWY